MINVFSWLTDYSLLSYSIILAVVCTYVGRYMGREIEKCSNWKDRFQLISLLFMSTLFNWFLIFLFTNCLIAWICKNMIMPIS